MSISNCALVPDHAGPVKAIGIIIGVPLGICMAGHIKGDILALALHGVHIRRELHGQQAGRLLLSGNQLQQRRCLYVKVYQEAVDRGKAKYEQRKKIEESLHRKEMSEKRKTLGLKVIKADVNPAE